MKKKGFTLVELLAVIAILAILVIIALPNVMGMFNEAKKNSFTTEVKQIYKQAQQKWISDSMFNTKEQTYSRCETCSGKSLDLTGRSELEYKITINKAGDVIKYYATDGTYQYKYEGDGLLIENINDIKSVADLSESEILTIDDTEENYTTVYISKHAQNVKIGNQLSLVTGPKYNTYQEAISALGYNFFIKLRVSNDIIVESYVGFLVNGTPHYIQGGDSSKYNSNKDYLLNLFGSSSCTINTNFIECNAPSNEYKVVAYDTGNTYAERVWYCTIYPTGESFCFDD